MGAPFQLGAKFGVGRLGGIEKTSLISLCRTVAHSITSSARARIDGGTVRPSALAVLRLITN